MADPFQPFKIEEADKKPGYDTRQVHAGARPDPTTKARAVPIYATAVSMILARRNYLR